MKLIKNVIFEVEYLGVIPVNENKLGVKKYIDYPHKFVNIKSIDNNIIWYSYARSKNVPDGIKFGYNKIVCNFKSSILTKIRLVN